uniref:Uncharacterized protein n=4 Tax=Dunaliella tertiolecta TaxID=3047 RepID=A0A7S3VM59_DUNTE
MTDVEVLSAAMRAGCIILCADIMVQGSLRRQQQQQQQCSSALVTGAAGGVGSGDGVQQQWGSDEVELGLALAAAAQQWLQNTRLAEELPPTATLLLQVNSSYFLCRQRAPAATQHDTSATATSNQHHQQQLAWEVQGPQPLSLLPHMQPLLPSCTIRTTSPSVLLPPSSPTFGSSSSSSSGCAPTAAPLPLPACASNTAASVAEGDGVMLQGSTHQHASHHSGGGAGAATGDLRLGAPAALVVRIRVQVPQCAEVLGWQEGEGGGAPRVFSSAVGSTGTDGASPAGNPRTPQLKVLACVGSRYLPTRVVCHPALPAAAEPAVGSPAAAESAAAKPAAAAPEPEARIGHLGAPTAGSGMETREFDLVIPVPEVHAALGPHDAHALPAGLRLELWHHELLLDFSLVLLVPSNLPGAHAELHRLPWGLPGADSDVSDFVVDLGAWMQRAGSDELQQSLHHSNPRTDQQAPVPAATPAATPAADRQAPSEIEAAPEAPRAGSSAGTPCAAPAAAPIAGTPDEPAAAPFVGMPGAAPAVAPAPAPVPLDAVALCGPGVQLLRQAVLWGMPCLSTLLVEKLLATLSWTHLVSAASAAPGTPSAVTPPPDPRNQQGAGQEMEGGEEEMEEEMEVVHVDDLGGLLHMSLLSPCPQQMLRAVIGWGKKWGQTSNTISTGDSSSGSGRQGAGAGSGFRWQWDEPNPLGLTPCQLLGSHTDKEALLQVVLEEDPAAWLSAQRALDAAARQERNLAGEKGTCDGGERRAGAQGDARNGFWSVSEGVRWRTLGQLGSFISSATKGVLRQRCNRELHMQGQQHGQTEDGALAAVADLAPPGVAPPAPATTEPPTPSAMIPHKRALWKAALRSTLFGLGDGTHWGGGLVGPSEQSYMQWAEVYTHNMLAMRFNFLLLGCVVGVVRSLANGLLCQSEVLLQYSITSAYFWGILKRRRKAGMRYARYGHIAMWAFLGLGILPMENNTISMVATYSESLVLFVLFSPVLEQSSLRALLLERLSTTWVFFLLFRTLGVWAPLHRAVVQNALSAAAELVFIGAHLRYTFLKSWADSQQQQAVQAKKGT